MKNHRIVLTLLTLCFSIAHQSASAQTCQCTTVVSDLTIVGALNADSVTAYGGLSIPQGNLWCGADVETGGSINAGTTLSTGESRASNTPGGTQGVAPGTIYADTTIRGWVHVSGVTGNMIRGTNIAYTKKISQGVYAVKFVYPPTTGKRMYAHVTLNQFGVGFAVPILGPVDTMYIYVGDMAGYSMDSDFSALFYGG